MSAVKKIETVAREAPPARPEVDVKRVTIRSEDFDTKRLRVLLPPGMSIEDALHPGAWKRCQLTAPARGFAPGQPRLRVGDELMIFTAAMTQYARALVKWATDTEAGIVLEKVNAFRDDEDPFDDGTHYIDRGAFGFIIKSCRNGTVVDAGTGRDAYPTISAAIEGLMQLYRRPTR